MKRHFGTVVLVVALCAALFVLLILIRRGDVNPLVFAVVCTFIFGLGVLMLRPARGTETPFSSQSARVVSWPPRAQ